MNEKAKENIEKNFRVVFDYYYVGVALSYYQLENFAVSTANNILFDDKLTSRCMFMVNLFCLVVVTKYKPKLAKNRINLKKQKY